MPNMNTAELVRTVQSELGLDQQELAKALGISPATAHRMLNQQGKEIDLDVHTLLECVAELLEKAKASGLTLAEIKNAAIKTGFAGVVARAATAGLLSQSRIGLLASAARFSWLGALGGIAGIVTGAAGLSFFQKVAATAADASSKPAPSSAKSASKASNRKTKS